MRKLLVSCAAAGSLILGAAGAAASQGVAQAATTESMYCDYTFANGICNMGSAQAGQQFEGYLAVVPADSGYFSVVSGTIPVGTIVIPFGEDGTTIGGTPTTAGTYTFTVSGSDINEVPIAPMTYQLTIVGNYQPPPLTIDNSSVLPSGTFETFYVNVFTNSGGTLPYTWSVTSGQLPPGMYLASDIEFDQTGDDLTGTPRTTGTFTFTMQVKDAAGHTASKQFTLTILPTPPPPPPPGHKGGGGGGQ
jgi:large repetitive protein